MSILEITEADEGFLRDHIITKLPLTTTITRKLEKIEIAKKRSIVSCENIIRGLALIEKWRELNYDTPNSPDFKSRKKLNNTFSNYQRADRPFGAGNKMEKGFMSKHGVTVYSSYKEIENKCRISFGIFGSDGLLRYVSPNANKDITFFYQDDKNYNKLFVIKNLKGFIRID